MGMCSPSPPASGRVLRRAAQALAARRSGDELHLDLAGEWRVAALSEIDKRARPASISRGVRDVRINTADLAVLDFSAAWRLREFLERVRQLDGEVTFEARSRSSFGSSRIAAQAPVSRRRPRDDDTSIEPVEALGRSVVRRWRDVVGRWSSSAASS